MLSDLKSELRRGHAVTGLIIVNAAVFLLLLLLKLIITFSYQNKELADGMFKSLLTWVSLPLDAKVLIGKPWTFITYMFSHFDIWHLFWNMIFLYWFGVLFHEYLGNRRVIPVYLLGGMAGGLLAIAGYYAFPGLPVGNLLIGASGAVYAIMLAAATTVPNYTFNLLLIGPVRIKYIVVFKFVIDLIALSNFENMGGHLAHLGGGIMGFIYVKQLRRGNDTGAWITHLFNRLSQPFRPKQHVRVVHRRAMSDEEYNIQKKSKQEIIDAILDKISKSGYESLTPEEKELLFKMSKDTR